MIQKPGYQITTQHHQTHQTKGNTMKDLRQTSASSPPCPPSNSINLFLSRKLSRTSPLTLLSQRRVTSHSPTRGGTMSGLDILRQCFSEYSRQSMGELLRKHAENEGSWAVTRSPGLKACWGNSEMLHLISCLQDGGAHHSVRCM